MSRQEKKRPCRYCKTDLNMWGPDRHGICPDCAATHRRIPVQCGRCKKVFELGKMEVVNLYFAPGHKGSKKVRIYYCQSCFSQSRSKVFSVSEEQAAQVGKGEDRMKRRAGRQEQPKENLDY